VNSIETNQLINRIQKELIDSGMDTDKLIPMLRDLRAMFSEAKQPRLTRMVRMTIEHIEANDTFLIEIPEEETEEDELEVETVADTEEGAEGDTEEDEADEDEGSDLDKQIESLDYMLQLMTKPDNKFNVVELNAYFKSIVADAKQ
jgi:hypothetical protein